VNRPAAPDDVFVESVLESSVWAKQHSRTLIIGALTLVALVFVFVVYRNTRAGVRERAETQLSALRPTVLSGNAPLAIRDLESYLARFGRTESAAEARVLLARAYLENKEPAKAIDLLRSRQVPMDDPLGPQTAMILGSAYEAAAQPDSAVDVYLRVGEGARFNYQKQLALDAAARIRFEKGDAQGAADLYERILPLLPEGSPDRPVYELRKAEAAARAGSRAGGAGS
jgi:predicted negative regulator of RcsB-dependent stress response